MSRKAVLFAGQGAQTPGMGKSLYDHVQAAKEVFDRAETVCPGIRSLCFEASQEELNQTIHTQPCVYTVDMAAFCALAAAGFEPVAGAGFSLGEYAALAASGMVSLEEGLKLVCQRAKWMQEQSEKTPGKMIAVLGKSAGEIEALLSQWGLESDIELVNHNCPGQIVVAGSDEACQRFLEQCRPNRVRGKQLAVSGAFHSKYMGDVSAKLGQYLSGLIFQSSSVALYSNVTAMPYEENGFVDTLASQTSRPVLFEQTIRNMLQAGIDGFVEVGPGKTLSGFVKRIDKEADVCNVSDEESFQAVASQLGLSL